MTYLRQPHISITLTPLELQIMGRGVPTTMAIATSDSNDSKPTGDRGAADCVTHGHGQVNASRTEGKSTVLERRK